MAKTGHFRAALTVSILLGALVTAPLQGEVATIGEANLVAANWLTYVSNRADGWDGDFSPTVTATDNLMWGDTLLARIYSVSPRGHVLVPVLKEIKPVKVYSVTSHFDVNQTHSFVQMLREILIFQVRLFVDSYGSMEASQPRSGEVIFLREARELWDRYAVSEKEFAKTLARSALAPETVVGPLLTDMWHQLYPYNMYCPMGDGGQCVVGCGATAISQVMHYWRCPPKGLGGLGSHSYWWNGDTSCGGHTDGQQLSADFTNSLDWDIMPDTLNAASPEESKEAVAELCYEVGISVNMDYGYCGSGCYMSPIPYAMKTYFRYLDAMSTRPRTSYTPITWFNLIKNEINNGRPILYGITSHLMVCDGWSDIGEINKYHLNYGQWDGWYTGWYAVDDYYCIAGSCSPAQEDIIIGIQPVPDWDSDGILNVNDNCPITYNPDQADADTDGVGDVCDNCVDTYNPSQGDIDGDSLGDVCDPDIDDDGLLNEYDNCDYVVNPDQINSDTDTLGDACDNCDFVDNNDQYDEWPEDTLGDACDGYVHIHPYDMPDTACIDQPFDYYFKAVGGTTPYTWYHAGGDLPYGLVFEGNTVGRLHGTPNWPAQFFFNIKCMDDSNPVKADTVFNLTIYVDSCPPLYTCGDADGSDLVNIADVVYLIDYIFGGGPPPDPLVAGDVDCDGLVNIADVVYLINYIFGGGPPPCDPNDDGVPDC